MTHEQSGLTKELSNRYQDLQNLITSYEKLAVAFSGGVDSTLLLKVAFDTLDKPPLAIYVDSALQPNRERRMIHQLARQIGLSLEVIELKTLNHDAFRLNPADRCYHCKAFIFDQILELTDRKGYKTIADGSNADDDRDYRPGKIALEERGVVSPLRTAGLTKADIRDLSRHFELPTWDKDELACLATRIPVGESITPGKLEKVDRIEEYLVEKGFRNVRARLQDELVSIEVRADQISILQKDGFREELQSLIVTLGLREYKIAEGGYLKGRMNQQL